MCRTARKLTECAQNSTKIHNRIHTTQHKIQTHGADTSQGWRHQRPKAARLPRCNTRSIELGRKSNDDDQLARYGSPIVSSRDCMEALLAGGVPNLRENVEDR